SVRGYEVGGPRSEGDEAAVGADRGSEAPEVSLVAGAVHAHAFGSTGLPVVDEHVLLTPVGVPGHEVGGRRVEGDEAAVGADRGTAAMAVPFDPGDANTHPLGGAGLPVVDEHVPRPIGVPGHEVRGGRVKGHEAAV